MGTGRVRVACSLGEDAVRFNQVAADGSPSPSAQSEAAPGLEAIDGVRAPSRLEGDGSRAALLFFW